MGNMHTQVGCKGLICLISSYRMIIFFDFQRSFKYDTRLDGQCCNFKEWPQFHAYISMHIRGSQASQLNVMQ